jgi:hypothetical protein
VILSLFVVHEQGIFAHCCREFCAPGREFFALFLANNASSLETCHNHNIIHLNRNASRPVNLNPIPAKAGTRFWGGIPAFAGMTE